MNYFSFHIGDYAAATLHLSLVEDAVFQRLLRRYYLEEAPLPADVKQCARLAGARSTEEVEAVENVLKDFFVLTDAGWTNKRADIEIAEYHDNINTASKAGKASAAKRAMNKSSTTVERPLNDRSTTDVVTFNQPITNNQEPITNSSVAKATGDKSPLSPDEIIFGYGIPLLVNAGTADKQARSFLGGLRKQHGDEIVVNTLRDCLKAKPLQPLEWLAAVLPPKGTLKRNKQEQVEDDNRAIVRRLLEKEAQHESI